MAEQTAPAQGERTGAQMGGVVEGMMLPGLSGIFVRPGNYATYRQMMADPTLALARSVIAAPIQATEWSIEAKDGVDDAWVKLIEEMFVEQRPLLLRDALRAMDYGWAGWEKVFEVREGRQWLARIKPLLHDITEIQIDRHTGQFQGFKQGDTVVPLANALLYSHDREGDNHYGRSRYENVRRVWSWWMDANDGAARYDRKLAGAWIVVHYPIGESIDKDGSVKPNWQIAKQLLDAIVSSGTIAVPNTFASDVDDLNSQRGERRQWQIEVLNPTVGGSPTQFTDRLRYLDSLKFRGMLRPERVAMEGQHGTKAESETQADQALTEGELLQQDIVRTLNWHAVDQVLALNFGEEARGAVWLSAMPLQDDKRLIFRELIAGMMANPATMSEIFTEIDRDAVFDLLDIPKSEQVVDSGGDGADPPDPDDPRAATIMSIYRELHRLRTPGTPHAA